MNNDFLTIYLKGVEDGKDKKKQEIDMLERKLYDLQQKIDKAIEILKNEDYIDNLPYIDDEVSDKRKLDYWFEVADKLDDKRLEALEILGDKENECKRNV